MMEILFQYPGYATQPQQVPKDLNQAGALRVMYDTRLTETAVDLIAHLHIAMTGSIVDNIQ